MKVGVLQFFSWRDRGSPIRKVYERAVDRIQLMEAAGYDAVWLAEHHFSGYSVCPSVHMLGVHVANHTTRLRIGMGVSVAPFYHPLRLAEEVALLDVLSGGRVNWGAGRGFDPIEFGSFGIPIEESGERFHEAVAIVQMAWTQERVVWEGKHWRFDAVEVLPKPLQDPHPPTWLAAGSPGAVRWAAKHGHHVMLGPHATFAQLGEQLELFDTVRRTSGHSAADRPIPIARFVALADTDAEAEQIARRGTEWLASSYMNASKATRPDSEDQSILTMPRSDKIRRYLESVVIHGAREKVIAQIQELAERLPLNYLMCAPLSHDSFIRFTHDVLPHL